MEVEGEGLVEVSIRTVEVSVTLRFVTWLWLFPPPPLVRMVAEGSASIVVLKAIYRTNVLPPKGTSVVYIK